MVGDANFEQLIDWAKFVALFLAVSVLVFWIVNRLFRFWEICVDYFVYEIWWRLKELFSTSLDTYAEQTRLVRFIVAPVLFGLLVSLGFYSNPLLYLIVATLLVIIQIGVLWIWGIREFDQQRFFTTLAFTPPTTLTRRPQYRPKNLLIDATFYGFAILPLLFAFSLHATNHVFDLFTPRPGGLVEDWIPFVYEGLFKALLIFDFAEVYGFQLSSTKSNSNVGNHIHFVMRVSFDVIIVTLVLGAVLRLRSFNRQVEASLQTGALGASFVGERAGEVVSKVLRETTDSHIRYLVKTKGRPGINPQAIHRMDRDLRRIRHAIFAVVNLQVQKSRSDLIRILDSDDWPDELRAVAGVGLLYGPSKTTDSVIQSISDSNLDPELFAIVELIACTRGFKDANVHDAVSYILSEPNFDYYTVHHLLLTLQESDFEGSALALTNAIAKENQSSQVTRDIERILKGWWRSQSAQFLRDFEQIRVVLRNAIEKRTGRVPQRPISLLRLFGQKDDAIFLIGILFRVERVQDRNLMRRMLRRFEKKVFVEALVERLASLDEDERDQLVSICTPGSYFQIFTEKQIETLGNLKLSGRSKVWLRKLRRKRSWAELRDHIKGYLKFSR